VLARLSKDKVTSLLSISRQALATIAAFAASRERPSGLQRLQGRKPVAFAAASVSYSCTFFGLAVRDGQDGRQ
jgi:hypothetical protein